MAFDFGIGALKNKLTGGTGNTTSASTSNTSSATQKKTPRKATFWRKFLSALKGFFVRK